MHKHRGVEQLVARRAHNPKVTGSSPVPATRKTKRLLQRGVLFYKREQIRGVESARGGVARRAHNPKVF